jgi:hypothetical protein
MHQINIIIELLGYLNRICNNINGTVIIIIINVPS